MPFLQKVEEASNRAAEVALGSEYAAPSRTTSRNKAKATVDYVLTEDSAHSEGIFVIRKIHRDEMMLYGYECKIFFVMKTRLDLSGFSAQELLQQWMTEKISFDANYGEDDDDEETWAKPRKTQSEIKVCGNTQTSFPSVSD